MPIFVLLGLFSISSSVPYEYVTGVGVPPAGGAAGLQREFIF